MYSKNNEVSIHKSGKTQTGTVFVPRGLEVRPFDHEINELPGLMMEHFYVKFC